MSSQSPITTPHQPGPSDAAVIADANATTAQPHGTHIGERSALDRRMRRVLQLPEDAPKATRGDAQRAFQTSMMVATVRCLLMYIVLPFVLPAIGFAAGVGPWIGLAISIIAIVAVTMSIRRFWRADHPKRWAYTILGSAVMGFMFYSMTLDITAIV